MLPFCLVNQDKGNTHTEREKNLN